MMNEDAFSELMLILKRDRKVIRKTRNSGITVIQLVNKYAACSGNLTPKQETELDQLTEKYEMALPIAEEISFAEWIENMKINQWKA